MSARSPEFREIQRQGVLFMLSLPEERFAAIRAVAPVIGRRPLEEQFDIGLDVQIEGIAARLAPEPRPPSASPTSGPAFHERDPASARGRLACG